MAKDKLYEARMQGILYAHGVVKKEGIEALERDIKKRNLLKLPLRITEKEIDNWFKETSSNMYNNMLTAVAYTLHNDFGFGRKRISDFKESYDKNVKYTLDLDYMGEHYVRLEDFALDMNEKYNLGIDVNRVAASQEYHDIKDEEYRKCKVDRVIKELAEAGFKEAADFISRKLD